MTLSKSKALFFLVGFVLGGLLMYMLLATFSTSSTSPTISEELSWQTSAGPRLGLPLPRLPVSVGASAVVDVKNSEWKLRKLDSSEVSFSEFAGKVIFLNLWGTWCEPCVWEMPHLQALYDSLKGEPIAFLTVADEPLATLRVFATKEALTMPMYQSVSKKPPGFDIEARPATLILNKTGNVVLSEVGAARWSDQSVIKLIRNLYK